MNEFTVTIIVLMLPGILGAAICDKITAHTKWTSFKFGIYALILGALSYVTMQMLMTAYDAIDGLIFGRFQWNKLTVWSVILNQGKTFHENEIIVAIIASIPLSFATAYAVNYKLIVRCAQKLGVTRKYGDENLYSYYLNSIFVEWVYIRDISNNLTYQGQISAYSESSDMQEIVLSNVSVFRYEDSVHLYDVPSVYVTKKLGELVIETAPYDRLEKVKNGEET